MTARKPILDEARTIIAAEKCTEAGHIPFTTTPETSDSDHHGQADWICQCGGRRYIGQDVDGDPS